MGWMQVHAARLHRIRRLLEVAVTIGRVVQPSDSRHRSAYLDARERTCESRHMTAFTHAFPKCVN